MPVALVNPTVTFGTAPTGRTVVLGPSGLAEIPDSAPEGRLAALASVNGLIYGTSAELTQIDEWLTEPSLSRTLASFCTTSTDAGALVDAVRRLHGTRALIVGCGGIGSLVAYLLAVAGVNRIVVMDRDVIEESNLNRQLFWSLADVGRYKVETLAERIDAATGGNVEVAAVREWATGPGIATRAADTDIVICAADEPPNLFDEVARAATSEGTPVLGTGYSSAASRLTFVPPRAVPDDDAEDSITWHSPPWGVTPSFGPTNAEVAGLAANFALMWCAGLVPTPERDVSLVETSFALDLAAHLDSRGHDGGIRWSTAPWT